MTGMDERLAKVAEVLAQHQPEDITAHYCACDDYRLDTPWTAHVAQALAPLLAEWQAEDEARVAGAVEAAIESHGREHVAGHKWIRDDHIRAALDAGLRKRLIEGEA